jgi:magnesium transporter
LVDVIRAVFEASNLLEQQRQGASTRQLAGWAAILGASTAIAGIYGMNFFEHARAALALWISHRGRRDAGFVGLYIRFKRLRWL